MTDEVATPQRESVLFVDDERNILSALKRLVKRLGVEVLIANSGAEGIAILEERSVDLIISDMRMPEMDGAQFLAQAKDISPNSIRMLLTGYSDMQSTIDALNKGEISRYISKPWEDDVLLQVIEDALKVKRLEREKLELTELTQKQNLELQELNKNLEAKVEQRTEQIRESAEKLDLAYTELKSSYDSFVRVFSTFINARPLLRRAESETVAKLAKAMAHALKLSDGVVQATYYAALLHQIGKASFTDELLAKPEDALEGDDKKLYEQYPVVGETAITAIQGLERTSQLIRSHTEYFDGTGYPDHLTGNNVRAGARILRAARDYIGLQTGILETEPLSAEKAMAKIAEGSGTLYDPIVVKCLRHFHKDYVVSALYSDEVRTPSDRLISGMRLTRDVISAKGLLLLSKGYILNEKMIAHLIDLEKVEEATFDVYVAREGDQAH